MPGVWDNSQFGFRPGTMKVPSTPHRTHHIVAALDDYAGNLPDLLDILDQIIVGWKETIVHEVVAFDAREGEGKLRVSKSLNRLIIKKKLGGAAFPDTPCAGGFDPFFLVITG